MKLPDQTSLMVLLLVVGLAQGCRRSDSSVNSSMNSSVESFRNNTQASTNHVAPAFGNDRTASTPRGDARARLREVFQRYQVCSYYRDNAVVTLRRSGPQTTTVVTTAPLRVELDHMRLNVDAYAARIRVDRFRSIPSPGNSIPIRLIAWFDEPETSNFDSQVLLADWSAAPDERLDLVRTLADEVLRSRLSAGLAGPPPQLEWLLADEPMSGLFRIDAGSKDTFAWLDDARLNDRRIHRIEVVADRDRFVFWIEPNTSLIQRVEFPTPSQLKSNDAENGGGGVRWELNLDLNEATFQPTGQPPFSSQPTQDILTVAAFVPIPPPPPSPLLGRRFDLREWDLGDPATVDPVPFCLIVNAPEFIDETGSSQEFAMWYQEIVNAVPVIAGIAQVHLVVNDRDSAEAVDRLPSPPVRRWNARDVEGRLRRLRLAKGSLVLLDSQGRVLLVETRTDRGTISNVLAVIKDSVSGVDIIEKIRNDYDAILHAYQAQLQRNAVRP